MIRAVVIATLALTASAQHARVLPVAQAHERAVLAAKSIERVSTLPIRGRVVSCTRRSRLTVDCEFSYMQAGRPSCMLLIRVRYASRRSRKTVASFPGIPRCQQAAATDAST